MSHIKICGKTISLFSFDLWETVIKEDGENERMMRRAKFLSKKLSLTPNHVLNALRNAAKHFFDVYSREQRTMSTRERIELTIKLLNKKLSEEDFLEVETYFSTVQLEVMPPLMENIEEFLAILKENNVKITMISDTGFTKGREMRKMLDLHGIYHYFDKFVFSDEEPVSKPHEHVFKKIEDHFPEISNNAMLHIGDNPRTDIAGAENRGWHTILFQRNIEISRKHFTERSDLIRVKSYKELISMTQYVAK